MCIEIDSESFRIHQKRRCNVSISLIPNYSVVVVPRYRGRFSCVGGSALMFSRRAVSSRNLSDDPDGESALNLGYSLRTA